MDRRRGAFLRGLSLIYYSWQFRIWNDWPPEESARAKHGAKAKSQKTPDTQFTAMNPSAREKTCRSRFRSQITNRSFRSWSLIRMSLATAVKKKKKDRPAADSGLRTPMEIKFY
jgi:hypothetical protein